MFKQVYFEEHKNTHLENNTLQRNWRDRIQANGIDNLLTTANI